MFNQKELELIKQGLDSLRVDLVETYSACKEVGLIVDLIKKQIEEVEILSEKVRAISKKEAESIWGIAEDLCLNPLFK
jgi:hypothetical protein